MSKKGVSNKALQKEKNKVIEDKTFGLKNKGKSAKVQKYMATVKNQVNQAGVKKKKNEEPVLSKKEAEKIKQDELNLLFKPVVQQQKVRVGVDPKSIVCQFFKSGSCAKGAKCKFSHDIAVARKAEKIDVYSDTRDEQEKDLMETWDDKKLGQVVQTKQSSENRNLKTEIVCRYFLEAIELRKYGWFWECPNGGEKCMYRHALPPGFILKKKEDENQEPEEVIPIEHSIEADRKALKGVTPVTLTLFLKWKAEKKERLEKEKSEEDKKRNEKAGRTVMSGREMFVFNPDLFVDDDEAIDDSELQHREDFIDSSVPHNIVTVTGTSISLTRLNPTKGYNNAHEEDTEEDQAREKDEIYERDERVEHNGGTNSSEQVTAIDESLFLDDENLPEDEE